YSRRYGRATVAGDQPQTHWAAAIVRAECQEGWASARGAASQRWLGSALYRPKENGPGVRDAAAAGGVCDCRFCREGAGRAGAQPRRFQGAAKAVSRRDQGRADTQRVYGGHWQRLRRRDSMARAAAPIPQADVNKTGRDRPSLRRDAGLPNWSHRESAGRDGRKHSLKTARVPGGAHEGRRAVPALRDDDLADRGESAHYEFLPAVPAAGFNKGNVAR